MITQPTTFAGTLAPTIRAPVQDDWAYILDSWKKSYRDLGNEKHIPGHLYWANQHAEIEHYRRDPKVTFRIAADPDDANFIWGWSCIQGDVLHYVFVRASAQGQGVARLLVAGLARPLVVTHWTTVAEEVHRKKPGSLLFEPSRRRR